MPENNRKEHRASVRDGVLYLHDSGSKNSMAQNGLAYDISTSGACIYTQQQFAEGETINVFCSKFGDAPIKSTVRWCKKVDERLYKVGVSFEAEML